MIFQVHTRGVPLAKDVDIVALAETTFGFVGADIALLVKEAAMNAIRKIIPLIDIDKEIPNEVIDQSRSQKETSMPHGRLSSQAPCGRSLSRSPMSRGKISRASMRPRTPSSKLSRDG